ncbi:hypothetical protein [Streptomyces sp. NPDC059787]|uniref:hypothetical protein n=1 Tax=Streptomyces sp. NPDC059787 TaxID=3346947 RepID=UPI00365D7CB8
MILVADKTPDGGARGFISCDHATLIRTRHGDDHDDTSPGSFCAPDEPITAVHDLVRL